MGACQGNLSIRKHIDVTRHEVRTLLHPFHIIMNVIKSLTKLSAIIKLVVDKQNYLCKCYKQHEPLKWKHLVKVCTLQSSTNIFQRHNYLKISRFAFEPYLHGGLSNYTFNKKYLYFALTNLFSNTMYKFISGYPIMGKF